LKRKKFVEHVNSSYIVDRTKENNPFAYQVYFVGSNREPWKEREIIKMRGDLDNSGLLKPGQFGTVVSYPDIPKGYTYFQYLDPASHASRGTLLVRNINLKPPQDGRKDRFSVDETRVDAYLASVARDTLFNFGVRTLRNRGSIGFTHETCPLTEFKRNNARFFFVKE
jgi:hypothetical protein